MSERKPEDCIVTINAHDFLKELGAESNKLAARGIVLSGRSLFRFTGKIFAEKVREQRAKEETSND